MSDDEDKDKGKKHSDSDFDKEARKGPLNPVNENLFNFLDGLFNGEGDFPESIQVITAKGRNKDQHGSTVKQYLFKNGTSKPTRERVVMMCNEIIHRVQVETDTLKRETVFKIGAMHHGRSDDFYETMRLTMRPKKTWQRGENGNDSRFGEDDDDDEMPPHVRYHTKFLEHIVQVNEQNRAFVEGYIDRTDRLVQFLTMDNDRLRMRNIEMFDVTERALSADVERKQKVQWLETRNKASDMALSTVGQLLPHMVASFMPNRNGNGQNGQPAAPTEWQSGQDSPDAATLSEFFKIKGEEEGGKLTRQEFAFMIGTIENNQLQPNGVLTLEQAQTLLAVAAKKLTPDALDELLPGGQYEIKQEQVMRIIQGGINPILLTPINMLFELRKERKKHQAPPQGNQGSNAPSP